MQKAETKKGSYSMHRRILLQEAFALLPFFCGYEKKIENEQKYFHIFISTNLVPFGHGFRILTTEIAEIDFEI